MDVNAGAAPVVAIAGALFADWFPGPSTAVTSYAYAVEGFSNTSL
jgi:hypothetical protein